MAIWLLERAPYLWHGKFATPSHRSAFLLWQVLGILDLVVAVALGTTAGLADPHGV